MKKSITEKLEIPEGIEAEVAGKEIIIRKNGKEVKREFEGFEVRKEGKEMILSHNRATKKEKKLIKTFKAHIMNIFSGLNKKYEYKLQICAVHFPINVSVDKAKKIVIIKNFLGEVKQRLAKIIDGVEVKIEKDIITVSGEEKEPVGQTSANIERAARITNRDRRVFQDGIFIIEKPGRKL